MTTASTAAAPDADGGPADDLADDLGRNIRALRRTRAMTLAELADLCGLSVGFLSHVERGRKKPSLSTLQKISAALGMEVGWFFPEPAGADGRRAALRRAPGRAAQDRL